MCFFSFSGFSVGCCINREKVICYQLEFRIGGNVSFTLVNTLARWPLVVCRSNSIRIAVAATASYLHNR